MDFFRSLDVGLSVALIVALVGFIGVVLTCITKIIIAVSSNKEASAAKTDNNGHMFKDSNYVHNPHIGGDMVQGNKIVNTDRHMVSDGSGGFFVEKDGNIYRYTSAGTRTMLPSLPEDIKPL